MEKANIHHAEEEIAPQPGTPDARNASKVQVSLSAEEVDFMDMIQSHDANALALSLREVHDIALYESDHILDEDGRTALFHLKVLWDGLEQMGRCAK